MKTQTGCTQPGAPGRMAHPLGGKEGFNPRTCLFRRINSTIGFFSRSGVDLSCLWFFCTTFSGFLRLLLQMDGYERKGDRNREGTERAPVS